jgi:hypothetical protein
MRSLRSTLMALALATVGGAAVLVPAIPAVAASSGCDFTMASLKARNLENDGGTDYAWLKVDKTWFPSGNNGVSFGLGTTHTAAAFANPYMGFTASGLTVKVVLDTWPLNTTVGTTTVACSPVTNAVHTFADGNAVYDLTYTVT